jgi:hypothetical protein
VLGLFENPVNPFPTGNAPTPAASVRRFLLQEFRPLRLVVAVAVATTILCAAIEVWLIGYAGRLVDTLAAASPDTLWGSHGTELLTVAAFVLLIRPVIYRQGAQGGPVQRVAVQLAAGHPPGGGERLRVRQAPAHPPTRRPRRCAAG